TEKASHSVYAAIVTPVSTPQTIPALRAIPQSVAAVLVLPVLLPGVRPVLLRVPLPVPMTNTPSTTSAAPTRPTAPGRSPSTSTAIATDNSGPLPRATGYTTDRSPTAWPRCSTTP